MSARSWWKVVKCAVVVPARTIIMESVRLSRTSCALTGALTLLAEGQELAG